MIDTHCHLTFPDFRGKIPAVLEEAARNSVSGCITISTTTSDCLEALSLATKYPNVWCTAGVHPLHSHEGPHLWANLKTAISHERCVAWGELGLDNHYTNPPRAIQHQVLAEQLAFIKSFEAPSQREGVGGGHPEARRPGPSRDGISPAEKPIVIHCREAFDDLLPILRASSLAPNRFVFHCFTGGPDDVRKVLDFGAFVSFTGVVTYRNAADVQQAARLVPLDRIMVETDAPFLSPEPKRGTRPCAPWMTSLTARFLADLRKIPWDDFHHAINQNTRDFFAIDAK